jgi:hypothetical protein
LPSLDTLPYRPWFCQSNTPSLSYGTYPTFGAYGFAGHDGTIDGVKCEQWAVSSELSLLPTCPLGKKTPATPLRGRRRRIGHGNWVGVGDRWVHGPRGNIGKMVPFKPRAGGLDVAAIRKSAGNIPGRGAWYRSTRGRRHCLPPTPVASGNGANDSGHP